jgi:uncharacterized protein YndB with AHSA1/START domain
MEKLRFTATINASKEKVWNALWEIHNYETWTTAFHEDSTVQTDNWKEGSKILFVDSNGQGMVATIVTNKPNEYMSFRHQGMVNNGVEDTTSDAVKPWAGAMENYTLKEENGKTTLSVEIDITEDYKEMFQNMWPPAMEKIKNLAEGKIKPVITVSAEINAPVGKVWETWTNPKHITHWNFASDDWHCPVATNDLKPGGKLSATMAAKDGSFSFDFWAVYDEIKEHELLRSTMGDGRFWKVIFKADGDKTKVTERFEAESENSLEMQHGGWQAILNNFKKYTELRHKN